MEINIINNNEQFNFHGHKSYGGAIYPWNTNKTLDVKIQLESGTFGYYITLLANDIKYIKYDAMASFLDMSTKEYTEIMIYKYDGFSKCYYMIWFKMEKDAQDAIDWINSIIVMKKLECNSIC